MFIYSGFKYLNPLNWSIYHIYRGRNRATSFKQPKFIVIAMPPRLSNRLISPAFRFFRLYSSDAGPLIRVTNIPTSNTGHIRILELNRPSARNAISKALLASLRSEIEDVQSQYTPEGNELPPAPKFGGAAGIDEKGPTRALILASAVDASFCAGADLKERRGFTEEELVHI